jgi:hypothetical protein
MDLSQFSNYIESNEIPALNLSAKEMSVVKAGLSSWSNGGPTSGNPQESETKKKTKSG